MLVPALLLAAALAADPAENDAAENDPPVLALRGGRVHTMAGGGLGTIENGVVLLRGGKVAAVGAAGDVTIPDGAELLEAAVVVPGFVDARATAGLTGVLNSEADSDQLESSAPIQPELRALDAYNPREPLVAYLRGFGVTTLHTGHAPGELISGQTMVVKTAGNTVAAAVLKEPAAVACTLGPDGTKSGATAPGTRGKQFALLRAELIAAREYAAARGAAKESPGDNGESAGDDDSRTGDKPAGPPGRDLRKETMAAVVGGQLPLLVTADRAQDIASALRLTDEFPDLVLWLDSAAEGYLLAAEIKAAGVPVIVHPTMARPFGEKENLTFRNAALLKAAGVTVALQSGYEAYVPKVRVLPFEAGVAAAHGLSKADALASITRVPAELLGLGDRIGTLEVGKDADAALFDGDPLEYTTRCTATVIDGRVVARGERTEVFEPVPAGE